MSEPKKPQDHKKPATTPYQWPTPDGRTINLKPFDRLPSGVFRKNRSKSNLEQSLAMVEAGAVSDDDLEIADDLAIGDLDQLVEDWAGEVSHPQSSSSSNS
ncbi:hypothetical protein [Aeromicrobium sp. Leaf291]|uniref:hypothetical protein n=1 Tax=Aeromicrobium sp. Leaf291 TaxID=1736325 RepID=UPI0006F3D62A|nr:hypothetical protein [Aeromicrobium sp. Leaf291]KQP83742.1 hypothetical protein ASF35_01825 [Aeromicrobium sp. Leaf291]RYE42583.1 MAG: hypothetical protein EOP24_32100 [Hyphomicrobiales bacterium]